MSNIVSGDEWNIVQEDLDPNNNKILESIFSLGNGYMGGRGNFEEGYSGDTLRSFFQAGVYYPDDALFGWYKVGYPKHNNKVINATDIIGIKIFINGERLDLANDVFTNFKRTLNMQNGLLTRSFILIDKSERKTEFKFERFLSMHNKHLCAISINIKPINYTGNLEIEPYMDGSVLNEDARLNKKGFWEEVEKDSETLLIKTKKTDFYLASSMKAKIYQNGIIKNIPKKIIKKDRYIGQRYKINIVKGVETRIDKLISCYNSRITPKSEVLKKSKENIKKLSSHDFKSLLSKSEKVWKKKWNKIDIKIGGDFSCQQSIRYNLFMINSTLTGEDPMLNISPKGFTGELYGGSTYWDTEIYCFPFFLYTDPKIAKNLLLYRYNHLNQAIENAKLLKLKGALYPMITIDGNEGHAEWEITLMEIHRNSAIVFAIYDYIRTTGDQKYMDKYGFEVIGNIARFWANRVTYDKAKDKYKILGVTGPDEFHNNINNNWYTNLMAKWVLLYAFKQAIWLKLNNNKRFIELKKKYNFSEEEIDTWKIISEKIYLRTDEELGIFIQFDGYTNIEQTTVEEIPKNELPLAQNWSWDKINRSSLIKQADVILGLYNLSNLFSFDEKKKNYNYYIKRTVHESSLSASMYSILAAEIGQIQEAYKLFKRSSRIDLKNYNNDTEHGLHVTSMCGSWLSIIKGFIGLKIIDHSVTLNPVLPKEWENLRMKILVLKRELLIEVGQKNIKMKLISGSDIEIKIYGKSYLVSNIKELVINYSEKYFNI